MSLTTCIKRAGKNLNAEDKNAILEAARANRKAGMSADDAAKAAVRARLEEVQALLAAEGGNAATMPGSAPTPAPTLRERAEAMADKDQPPHIKGIQGWWGVGGTAGQSDALTIRGREKALQNIGAPINLAARYWTYLPDDVRGKLAELRRQGWNPDGAPAPTPSANTIFTEDAAAAARARLKAKLGRLQSGIDPETMMDGITLAGYHIEKGARTFAAYARAMVADLGDAVKPYLQSWYMAVRSDPRAGAFKADMDKASAVEDLTPAEIDALAAESAQNAAQEKPDDPAPEGLAPTLDQPVAEGPAPEAVRRGAKQPRRSAGRADDRGVRGQGGLFEGTADEGSPLGNRGEPDAVPAGADGAVAGRVPGVPTRDFRPKPGDLKREGSWFATAARNIDLIDLARRIESEGRLATPEEQAQLAKYVGFGASEIRNNLFPVPSQWARAQDPKRLIWPDLVREARWKPLAERMAALPEDWQRSVLQSTQYAHYTSEGVIRSVWSGLQRLGFTGGKVLEPGMGIGSFNMLMPDSVHATSRYTGVEFDGPTALIARLLSPDQNMLHEDFIKRKFPRDYFDVAVGNPPFSQTKILGDPDYEKFGFMLHDFFFAKSLDRVRPGGLLVFVTSKGTMDKQSDKARKYLAERADLLGAIRLPSTAFEDNAGTSVVTDVLFLRKRAPGQEPAGPAWQGVQTIETKDGPAVVNEYFAANPDMVLGEQRISGNVDDFGRRINSNGMGGAKYTVVSYDSTPEQLDERFAKAIERLPENVYSPLSANSEQVKRETAKVDFDPSVKREGVVYVGKDGTLMRVQNGVGVALAESAKLSPKDVAWFKGYVGVRDMVQAARLAQVQDGNWEAALKALNKAYDAFRKEHGPINDFRIQTRTSTDEEGNEVKTEIRVFKNRRLFREDYDSAVMTQLEVINEAGEIVKAPFLLGRTIGKPVVRTVKTIGDALAVSLDETGRLDLDDIARRMSLKRDEVIEALGNQIYKTPAGKWQLADEYLSGDVVAKLEEAELAARLDPSLARNVEALKAVQPEKLGPSQISVKAGASWVPVEYVNEFAREIGAGPVSFDPKTESWQVQGGNERSARRAGAEYGTADRSASELLESVLNSQSITIKRTDADKKTYTDTAATTAANEMARKIKDKFKSWIWTDADRASNLVELYNKRFNNIAPRRFDGSHMTLPGVSLRFSLHPHQKRAIWRQVQTGNTYLAHAVGAGKTIEMIAGGMEQKRLGLINKPIYAVPNHMLEQFANEFMELYPLANIMVADDENFSAERRKAFVAAATLNAPDAIVITHSAFERIGVKEETVAPIRDEILDDLQTELDETGKADRVRRSQLQQQIEAVTQRFDSIVGSSKKDSTIKFEDIGADFVYVDEAHAFRKLDFTTNQKIKGIDPNGSRRALDMYVKTRYLERQRPGRAMVFASGTPVTNTMGELYTIMRFFAPEELSKGGISTFDAWARQFGESVPALEANAAGRYEVVERFAKFDNVPELMSRVRQFMDVLTSEHLGALVKRPDIEGGKPDLITVEATDALKQYMKTQLLPRLEASRKWKPSKDEPFNPDPVIAITSDGRFAALDPRFVVGAKNFDEDKTPTKLTRMADEVARVYKASAENEYLDKQGKPEPIKGSTQIVFYNLGFGQQSMQNRGFDARGALTKRLVAQGVKRDHILWFDDADTDAKKEAMFKAMRNGQARVLIGSAKKMGTGVNVQKRLLALHYFDPPWYPSDVEQPHGRIIRQGNQNSLATIKWYATKGTYDSTMWQMVARKQRFIDQAFSGDKSLRSMDDMSEASMFEQAAAVASGDPRALQLAGLRQDVERLERLQAAHASEQIAVRSGLRSAEWNVETYTKRVQTYSAALKVIGGSYYGFSTGTVGDKTYDKVGEFGQALKDAFNQKAADAVMDPKTKTRELATLPPGITVRMEANEDREGKPTGEHEMVLRVGPVDIQVTGYAAALGEKVDAVGLGRRVINSINSIDSDLSRAKSSLANEETDAARLRKKLGAPFEYQQELAEKIGELKRLEEELRAEGEAEARAAAAPEVVVTESGDTGPALSRSPLKAGFVSPRTLRDEVAKIVANWNQDLADVEVVNRVEDLPADIQQAVRNVGSENTVRGLAMPDGRVFLVAENISTLDEGRFVLFHETYGHIGMRAFLGDGYDLQMRTLRQANPALAKEADAWFKLYGEDEIAARIKAGFAPLKARQMVNALAVEEALADRAGTLPELKGWKRLMAALQRGLRRLGLGSVADMLEGMTEAETLDLLVNARRTVQRGQMERGLNIARMPAYQRVWHGTPYRGIEQFSTDAIGTGEGAQAYGWGLYFAGKREVADYYRKKLAGDGSREFTKDGKTLESTADLMEAYYQPGRIVRGFGGSDKVLEFRRTDNGGWGVKVVGVKANGEPMSSERPRWHSTQPDAATLKSVLEDDGWEAGTPGQLYEVEIPEDSEMLLWDKPLSEQPAKVREALMKALGRDAEDGEPYGWKFETGRQFYRDTLQEREGSDRGASEWLQNAGIRGIKYLDGTSRNAGDGTYNYVIFDGADAKIQGALFSRRTNPIAPVRNRALAMKVASLNMNPDNMDDAQAAIGKGWRIFGANEQDGGLSEIFDPAIVGNFSRDQLFLLPPERPMPAFSRRTSQDILNAGGGVQDFSRYGTTKQDRIRGVTDKAREFWLGALTRDQIADVYGKDVPQVREYDGLVRSMENERSSLAQRADDLYQRWAKLDAETNDKLGRIMLDATTEQVHPDSDDAPADKTKVQIHAKLRAQFKLLPPEAQAMYREVRGFHAGVLKDIKDALVGRIERQVAAGAERAALLSKVQKQFDQYLENGPYFPLSRFGDYLVIATRPDGERVVAAYENSGEQQAAARELRKDGFTTKLKTAKEYARSQDGSAGKFIGDVIQAVEKVDMVEATINGSRSDLKNQLLDDLNQLFIRSLPDLSYRKHFAHRKNTPGFSADVMRGFASSAFHAASYIARLNHADKMTMGLQSAYEAIDQASSGDFNTQSQVLNELSKRHEAMLNPNTHPLSALATQVGFVMHLGLSPAAGLINMLQVPMVTIPYLGARHGFAKASAAMGKAYADIMKAPPNAQSGFNAAQSLALSAEERQAISTLQDEGVIDLTQAHDLAAATDRDVGDLAKNKTAFAMARAMRIVGWTFHVPEVMNRQTTALMAYRLEREKGAGHEAALEAARETIKRTQFDYSTSNRARYMQGNIARVVLQFKQFSQNMTYFLGRAAYQALKGESPEVRKIARRQILSTFVVTGAMAGSLGLPGVGAAMGLVGLLVGAMDDADEPWDWQTEYRNMLADQFGKEWGEVFAKGVPRMLMPGWDIAGRVSLSDLWWRSNDREGQNPRESFASDMANILGPTAGTLLSWYVAADHMERGQYDKAVEAVVPKFIRDPLKAYREADEGVTSYNGDPLMDVEAVEVLGRALGFAPARVSEMYEGRNAVMNTKTALEEKRQRLLNKVVKARLDGDREAEAEARSEVAGFNSRNPDFKITNMTIARSLLNRRRNRENTEQGILLPDTKADLRERARFANVE